MAKKGSSSNPPAPDPTVVANAQSAANIASAQAQQKLNMINTQGPTGSVNYQADANSPGGYTQVTALSPAEQATYDRQKAVENGALDTAGTQLGRVNTALATPLDTTGLPGLQGAVQGGAIQSSFNPGQALQYSFDPGQAIQGQVGAADLYGAAQQAQDAVYGQATSRLDPRFEQEDNAMRTRLANQGLSQNSTAYQTAEQNQGRVKNDAYNQAQFSAIGAGNDAAQQLFQQSLQQGQFANSAAGQEYNQNQGQAAFHNATGAQDYSQNQGLAQFANTAQNQGFQQDLANAQLSNTARNQGLQERAYQQNMPINQLTGLLGLGQVGTPQGVQYTPSQVGQTDVTGAYALQAQAQQAAAQRAQQQQSGLMGGLMSLGSAAIMASDERLKTDVRLIRRRKDGLGVYSFRYRSGGPARIGVMAQEVKRVRPDLVVKGRDGMLAVNYEGLGAL